MDAAQHSELLKVSQHVAGIAALLHCLTASWLFLLLASFLLDSFRTNWNGAYIHLLQNTPERADQRLKEHVFVFQSFLVDKLILLFIQQGITKTL